MKRNQNIILIASITAVLGFGILAFQTDNVSAFSLMDNSSEILDLGEKGEITTLAKPSGAGKKISLEGKFESGFNKITCSASNILSCSIKNSGDGLDKVVLNRDLGDKGKITCAIKDVRDGAARASVNTRKNINPDACDYQNGFMYLLEVRLLDGTWLKFSVKTTIDTLTITSVSIS